MNFQALRQTGGLFLILCCASYSVAMRPAFAGPPEATWEVNLERKLNSKVARNILIYGNIRDHFRTSYQEGGFGYVPIRPYLEGNHLSNFDIVVYYDRSEGIKFQGKKAQELYKDFNIVLTAMDEVMRTNYAEKGVPRDPATALSVLENYVWSKSLSGKTVAVVMDYMETISDLSDETPEEKAVSVQLQKWINSPRFDRTKVQTIFLTEEKLKVNKRIVENARVVSIEVPVPSEGERLEYINSYIADFNPTVAPKAKQDSKSEAKPEVKKTIGKADSKEEIEAREKEVAEELKKEKARVKTDLEKKVLVIEPAVLARMTSGMNYDNLKFMLAEHLENGLPLNPESLIKRKKEVIDRESNGMLEFIEPKYTLEDVGGNEEVKASLRTTVQAIKEGNRAVVPMGYLFAGTVGTGKTFIVTALAGEIGIPVVMLKNFRSMWQGESEANLEKIFRILSAMEPVMVVIDEADTQLGKRGGADSGSSATDQRILGKMLELMGNTEKRGKIIWALMTSRPDRIQVDFIRSGRADVHVSLFNPRSIKERRDLFKRVLKKTQILSLKEADFSDEFFDKLPVLSGADYESVLTKASAEAFSLSLKDPTRQKEPTRQMVETAFANFKPAVAPEKMRALDLIAVKYCTDKTMIPSCYAALSEKQLNDEIDIASCFLER